MDGTLCNGWDNGYFMLKYAYNGFQLTKKYTGGISNITVPMIMAYLDQRRLVVHRLNNKSKMVTDGTVFVNSSNLLHICLNKSVPIHLSTIISTSFVPTDVIIVVYHKNGHSVIIITPF